ncbi:hypothetical protein B0H15DRAFT_945822 [Mycena belliarum]|uniref:Uncharacterized protein n=1 Tax=Mycena belliarum TaxID=1033014 RepID=A0AAD6UAK5_9AGAR|nr:hypothetical protein B0H15DRAFT_945822 [Mycena belliae]
MVNVANGAEREDVGSRTTGFKMMLAKFVNELPDMDFPINAKSEGRVVMPLRAFSLGAGWARVGYEHILERWAANTGAATSTSTSVGTEFGFARATNGGAYFCAAPHAHYEHGQILIPALVPVFSSARACGILDVRIPSHYYYYSGTWQ